MQREGGSSQETIVKPWDRTLPLPQGTLKDIFEFFYKTKKKESEVAQSCPTLCNPIDYSLPGSSIHGIFQAKIRE